MSRRRSRKGPEEHHVDERWMASYMDMVTVLMCLFIVLFSMSTVDQDKYEKLKSSLATGFGETPSETVDTAEGIIVPEENVGDESEVLTDMQAAEAEVADLNAMRDDIQLRLDAIGLGETVRFSTDEAGLTMRMVNSEAFFSADSAALLDQAVQLLDTTAPVISSSGRQVSVEGHTADQPGDAMLRDWELSSERAVNVVRYLIDNGAISPRSIEGTGYAGYRPLVEGYSAEAMQANRRVDLVLHSDEAEAVRALLPEVAASHG